MIANEIVKTALLGTDKYMPQASPLLGETGTKLNALQTDKEDRFLKTAITSLLFEETGKSAIAINHTMPECEEEPLPTISRNLENLVASALEGNDEVLLGYFLYLIHKNQQVIAPRLVPSALNKALENKKLAQDLVNACGKTGEWLGSLNDNWRKFFEQSKEDDLWETGTLEQRKAQLIEVRQNDPIKAVELLTSIFSAENAANRLMFLEQIHLNLSLADEPFLLSVSKDKSQKVKEAAMNMLKKIQGSAINNLYLEHLTRVLNIKEERHLLIAKKKVLDINKDIVPIEEIFNSGIDRVSSTKGVDDYIYVTGQLLSYIDPSILAKHLKVTLEELIQLFFQHKRANQLVPFLAKSAALFKNETWATVLLQHHENRNLNLLAVLSAKDRLDYYQYFIEGQLQNLLNYVLDDEYHLLPVKLAAQVLAYLAKNPYQLTLPTYQRLALQLPNEILDNLKKYSTNPNEDYQIRYFKTKAAEMMRIIELRNNIS